MEYINGVSSLYIRKFARKVEQYNKPMQLPDYFGPMIGDKTVVYIAEVGAGPVNTIGNQWPKTEVHVRASDVLANEYRKLWNEHKVVPLIPVLYNDMEKLNYADELFDIVHCVNALDHTKNAFGALLELERICKKGGYVYLRHSPNQLKRFGGHHYWNITCTEDKPAQGDEYFYRFAYNHGSVCKFENEKGGFLLPFKYQTHLEGDLIVSIWKKT